MITPTAAATAATTVAATSKLTLKTASGCRGASSRGGPTPFCTAMGTSILFANCSCKGKQQL